MVSAQTVVVLEVVAVENFVAVVASVQTVVVLEFAVVEDDDSALHNKAYCL